jgi:SAM-dependent methyltransferase
VVRVATSSGCPADPVRPAHWEGRWVAGDTPWDLGAPPPVLADVIARAGPGRLRVLVPGAGGGQDAVAWARAGHDVVAVDFATTAVVRARRLAQEAGVELRVIEADVLELPPELRGAFDLVWEHTCFCALPPERRAGWVQATARALRPGGRVVALLWNHRRPGGPPFDVEPSAARASFSERFDVVSLEPVLRSAPGREGEFLLEATLRGAGTPRPAPPGT